VLAGVVGLLVVSGGLLLVGARTLLAPEPSVDGVFVDGPSLAEGHAAVEAVTLPDDRVVIGVVSPESDTGRGALRCTAPCRPHLSLLDPDTGSITLPRDLPPSLPVEAMALLHDGRVLLIGSGETAAERSAWIYDPVADRHDPVGDPIEPRFWPLVVTLADGRVLVGGGDSAGPRGTAELFDPATGTFSTTGDMTRPRGAGATGTLLPDGRVLVLGGGAEVGTSAELYDPGTGTFAPTGSMTQARGGFHTATRLPDGRVLVAGGLVPNAVDPSDSPDGTAAAEIYDPATGTFTPVGSMASARFFHGASILPDGRVLAVGGAHEIPSEGWSDGLPTPAADAEIFDPATGTFARTGDLRHARLRPVTILVDGRVLVLGTFDPDGSDPTVRASMEWFE
jgi:hypothetical protein